VPYRPGIDLDLPIRDRLRLRTVAGAVDYLAEECRRLGAPILGRDPDGLVIDYAGPLRPIAAIRYFDICTVDPDRIKESLDGGVLSALRPDGGTLRFRVGQLGETRWEIAKDLESTYGWRNDPDAWDVNLEPGGVELGALYLTRRFGELRRMPASTNPVIGAVLVRLAKIEEGQTVVDPFCGAGTLLVLAGELARPGRLAGFELEARWARLARENLATRTVEGAVFRADASELPLGTATTHRVLANIPFGKRVGTHRVNEVLYPRALAEIARVLPGGGRAVLLTDDKRLFRETVQRTHLIRVIKEVVLSRGGLHPSAYVVTKRGRR
jgi:SAM-dependent methyltransferase